MKRQLTTLTAAFLLASLLGLALAVPLLLGAASERAGAPGAAPNTTPSIPSLTFEGMVHAVGTGSPALWVVGDLPVTVITSTTIISNGLPARPGVWARVEAVKTAGLQATTLELQAVPTSDLYDRIEVIDDAASLWRVGQTWVTLGPDTEVIGALPVVGNLAWVHGSRSGSGIEASRIMVVASDDEVVYQGTLTLMLPTVWQVDDVVVEIAASTVYSGTTPVLGGRVQARGAEIAPRHMRAAHIWTLEEADPQVTFIGWLQRIDGQGFPYLWRVNLIDGPSLRPVFVGVYDDTLIDETAGPAAPGAWLSASAVYQGNSYFRANRILVLPRAPKQQFIDLVVALPASGLLGIWEVGPYRVEVSQSTGIVGTPQVGSMVWVSGTPDYANVIQAQLIAMLL